MPPTTRPARTLRFGIGAQLLGLVLTTVLIAGGSVGVITVLSGQSALRNEILSAFFAALTTILAKIGVSGTSSNLATAIRTVVILILAWSIASANGEIKGISSISQKTWIFLILSGFATGLS